VSARTDPSAPAIKTNAIDKTPSVEPADPTANRLQSGGSIDIIPESLLNGQVAAENTGNGQGAQR